MNFSPLWQEPWWMNRRSVLSVHGQEPECRVVQLESVQWMLLKIARANQCKFWRS
jgi:hypothetical protein